MTLDRQVIGCRVFEEQQCLQFQGSEDILEQWIRKCPPGMSGDPWKQSCNGRFEVQWFVENNGEIGLFGDLLVSYDRWIRIKKHPVPTKQATFSLINVKS